ncbi:MAG TPA: hypothetical protein VF192_04870 [Longimicrobiales bacterium]
MAVQTSVHRLLEQEARALLTRLARVKPFALHETMVPAAAPSVGVLEAVERYLVEGRGELRSRVHDYLAWLHGPGRNATPEQAHRRFVYLRLRFNVVLSHFDIFADVMTQRSEHETGAWMAGLDVVAADALELGGGYFEPPPVVCYLDRGHGAAIRRARTRLPGGGLNPVAIVRVPRERVVGTGIASSLVHEVGHQGAALLDLNNSLRAALRERAAAATGDRVAWQTWERWISEIVADLWSVARVGVGSTMGLIGVVSLPRAFVLRINADDPHPVPWIRVRVSSALGAALYPDPQWQRLFNTWKSYYPLTADMAPAHREVIAALERTTPELVRLILTHRPAALKGDSILKAMRDPERLPDRLREKFRRWNGSFLRMRAARPSLVFAALGQARADGVLTPERESRLLADLLTYWALRRALDTTRQAAAPRRRLAAAATT